MRHLIYSERYDRLNVCEIEAILQISSISGSLVEVARSVYRVGSLVRDAVRV
jgi:hypothetical protein